MAENKMCFPETWEEFRKQYQIVDTEKVYTNGIEMIPTFRVKQWLDHMESVKRSQQSEQNKMAEVAKMFGKKMGEVFTVTYADVVVNANFTSQGLCVGDMSWGYGARVLSMMLLGEAEIVRDEK